MTPTPAGAVPLITVKLIENVFTADQKREIVKRLTDRGAISICSGFARSVAVSGTKGESRATSRDARLRSLSR
jgi:hypothetical protein